MRRIYLALMKRMKWLPSPRYVGYYYEYYTGRKYNDADPKEFGEKIQWYKAHYRPKVLNMLVDKYAVREYVKEKIGEQYLNECLGVYDKVSDIDFDALPDRFVIKGVHGCGFNLIVPDKSKLCRLKARLQLHKWMHRNQYYRGGQEWAYRDVPPRLIVERYLEEPGRSALIDYKFFCFGGKPKFVEVHLDRRQSDYSSAYFDFDFKMLPFNDVSEEMSIHTDVARPENLDEMIALAERLADRFPFVRVDFYSVQGKTIFGEMTFYPADGRYSFHPEEYNRIIGDMITLPKLPPGESIITQY